MEIRARGLRALLKTCTYLIQSAVALAQEFLGFLELGEHGEDPQPPGRRFFCLCLVQQAITQCAPPAVSGIINGSLQTAAKLRHQPDEGVSALLQMGNGQSQIAAVVQGVCSEQQAQSLCQEHRLATSPRQLSHDALGL